MVNREQNRLFALIAYVPWRFASRVRWAPLAGLSALLVWQGVTGRLQVDLALVLLLGAALVAWWLARGWWTAGVVVGLMLAPLLFHVTWQLPGAEHLLRELPPRTPLRITGTVRQQERLTGHATPRMALLLGEVLVESPAGSRQLAELRLELPVSRPWWRYQGRRRLAVAGALAVAGRREGRLAVTLRGARYHFLEAFRGDWAPVYLQAALASRARYYLSDAALGVYEPVLLGLRQPETTSAREVVRLFRRTGAAHLFAISGLHVGLLYLLFMVLLHHGIGWALRGQGLLYLREGLQVTVVLLLWAYLGLIGFPVTAVRAAVMGSMLVWADLWGTRTPRSHVLALAGFGLLAWAPSQIYDLSFQLSFLAYGCLLLALAYPEREWTAERQWLRRMGQQVWRGSRMNLLMTFFITLGLWPLISSVFGTVSLLTFIANLLMIPLLSLVVLPLALWAMLVSLLALGQPPEGWLERISFRLLEAGIDAWVAVIRTVDAWGSPLTLRYRLTWPPSLIFAYYVAFFAGSLAYLAWRRRQLARDHLY